MKKLIILVFLPLMSCATFWWDRGFDDGDKSQFLLSKANETTEEAQYNIRKYPEARDYLLRAKGIERDNNRIIKQLESLEIEIVNCKRAHYGLAALLLNQKSFIDAAIQFNYVFLLKFWDKPDDMIDRYARNLYDKYKKNLDKDIILQLTNAQKKLNAKDYNGAYTIYNWVLMADPGNNIANQKMNEKADKNAIESRRMYDIGRKYFDKQDYDTSLYYLKKSLILKKDGASIDLINRITIIQINNRHIKNANSAIGKGDVYEALKLYRYCKYNDPSNLLYVKKVKELTEQLKSNLGIWYTNGVAKYEGGDLESAIYYFERIITVDENYKDAYSLYTKSKQKLDSVMKIIE